jgi:hypothetical protein
MVLKSKVYLPLIQTTGSPVIDLDGLNPEDKLRITQVGFRQWLDEAADEQEHRFGRRGL